MDVGCEASAGVFRTLDGLPFAVMFDDAGHGDDSHRLFFLLYAFIECKRKKTDRLVE